MSAKRLTCLFTGHKWSKVGYPGSEGTGHYLKCRRCRHEDHKRSGSSILPTAGLG